MDSQHQTRIVLGGELSTRSLTPSDQRRHEIVQRAAELFDDVGYNSASMEQLAEAVGLAKPTLYHYFRGKEEILYKIHQEFIGLLISRQEARNSLNGASMPTDQLLAVMADILELMKTHRGHVRVFFEHHREIPGKWHEDISVERERYRTMVERIIHAGVEAGEFRSVDIRLTTLAIFGMCNWAYQWYQPNGSLEPSEIAELFHSLLCRGLSAGGGA